MGRCVALRTDCQRPVSKKYIRLFQRENKQNHTIGGLAIAMVWQGLIPALVD